MNCFHCHTCGTRLRSVLDGEEWCPKCGTYRRYASHGWAHGEGPACPPHQQAGVAGRTEIDAETDEVIRRGEDELKRRGG